MNGHKSFSLTLSRLPSCLSPFLPFTCLLYVSRIFCVPWHFLPLFPSFPASCFSSSFLAHKNPIGFKLRMHSVLGQCLIHSPAVPQQHFSFSFLQLALHLQKDLINLFFVHKVPISYEPRPFCTPGWFLNHRPPE
jgi:hypothetical protein